MSLVIVSSLAQVTRMAHRFRAEQVISLLDPGTEPPTFPGINHLLMAFEDREDIRGPNYGDIRRIFAWAHHNCNLVVHCWAGMGRSPALAIGLLISRGLTPLEATRQVLTQNYYDNEGSYMEPNMLVLAHVDRFLSLGNTLQSIVQQGMLALKTSINSIG